MKKQNNKGFISQIILLGLAAASVAAGYFLAPKVEQAITTLEPQVQTEPSLGASNQIPTPIALFETTLASSITSSATSFTLTSAVDKDGTTFASSTYAFIIDEGTASEEFVIADCTGATCTNATRGVSVRTGQTEVTALKKAHRRGASVKITDAPSLLILSRLSQGVEDFANVLRYSTSLSTSTISADPRNLVNVELLNDIAFSGAGVIDATTLSKGVVEFATQVEMASSTAVGDTGNLALASQYATSSPPSSGHYIPVTDSTGVIAAGFISSEARPPVGTITPYASSTAPTGWLNADGSAVSRTTYSTLFNLIGTTYGSGDGSTTFNLPDLKSRFPLGYSASAPTKVFTFSSRSSNTITVTSDVLTNSTTNELQTGQKVRYSSNSGTITGLTNNTDYYLIRVAYNQFRLASSLANANKGTAVSLSSDGSGTQTFTITYTARAIASKGGQEVQATFASHSHQLTGILTQNGSDGLSGTNNTYNTNDSPSTDSAGVSEPSGMPLFTVVNYIIKY